MEDSPHNEKAKYIEQDLDQGIDEMWRQSDDEEEDDDLRKSTTKILRFEKDMEVDEGCAEVSERLKTDCFCFITSRSIHDRITSSQLQAQLQCSRAQSMLLITKMVEDGMLKRVQCSRIKTRVYKYAHASSATHTPLAPPNSRQGSTVSTISMDDPVYVSTPRRFTGEIYAALRLATNGAMPSPLSVRVRSGYKCYVLPICFGLIACMRSAFGYSYMLSRIVSFFLTSNRFSFSNEHDIFCLISCI